MGAKTGISWTDSTFNIAWGCEKVSPGCKNCYAETFSNRVGGNLWGPNSDRRTFGVKHWGDPIRWNAAAEKFGLRRKVFTSSMSDVFEDHPTMKLELVKLWNLIRITPNLDWQILTKRADRIATSLPADWSVGWHNVWLGVSVENSDYLWRTDHLRKIPAVVRFVSYEPALGPLYDIDLTGIDWVIYGWESGAGFRDDDKRWARWMRMRARECGVAYFCKQKAGVYPGATPWHGEESREFPVPREGCNRPQRRKELPFMRL